MKGFKALTRKLSYNLIILLFIASLSQCTQVDKNIEDYKNLDQEKLKSSTNFGVLKSKNRNEICRLCGCDTIEETTLNGGFKSYTCNNCNITELQKGDCILQGAVNESENSKNELVHGLKTSIFGDYRTLFYGKSDFLTNLRNGNNLLARIFEPEFTWERFSHGSIKDNCRMYRDEGQDFDHFKLSYTYTLYGDKNCTNLLLHFVNKYSGSTLYKNLNLFKGFENDGNFNSMMVFRHDDVKVRSDSFEKFNLHQEFNITYYDLPPKYLFSNEQQEWVPFSVQNPQVIINPKVIHERLLLIFQLINSQITTSPSCKLDNIKVKTVIQCKSVAFPPNPKYTKEFVEDKLSQIYLKYNEKKFKLFLNKFEEKLINVLSSIPNALLSSNNNESRTNTPLSELSIPCKEALYLGDIPKLMSKFNYTSKLVKNNNSRSYITSAHILEDKEENQLLNNIENALNTN